MSLSLSWPAGPLHDFQRRYLAEDLVRLRRAREQRRYAAPQRAARIDPNPHQIQAVMFALERIRQGGCILADEVGLGKTIEAGLVIAQLLAEGAKRVLLIAPKALLGQWRQELFQLFDIEALEADGSLGGFDGQGVFLMGREAAGSERGRTALLSTARFDLCVIDEAHEVFAGIYKRFNELGEYEEEAREAKTAGRVREFLLTHQTPVLLLTATPIQNSLAELWGLVQYVDPLGTLLGDLPTFRAVFCPADDRHVARGHEEELRTRLSRVVQRTLRRQAQEFLETPFVARQAKLFEYTMSPAERELYDDVTRYLLQPGIVAFQGSQRRILLLGFHRRMASSTRALAASLQTVANRLERKLRGEPERRDDEVRGLLQDLEDDDLAEQLGSEERESDDGPTFAPEQIRAELQRVEAFVRRARAGEHGDSKFQALLRALSFVTERGRRGQGAGKLVIFTESLVTQDYLRERLAESGLVEDQEITLFRGQNDSKRAQEALAQWLREVPQENRGKTSREMLMRLALVHEFRTRSRVFISTEAGAKGLNLQFCDTLVNYDLPWNPQRIEQRIGRCHRYGQKHGVTVINFLASDNEAQRLTFDILSQKLELFGAVLSATDEVLHQPESRTEGVLVSAIGAEFESELRRIYDRSRTVEEVTAELRALREKVGETRSRFEEAHARTQGLIETSLDADVRSVLRSRKEELGPALALFDNDLLSLVTSYLTARGVNYTLNTEDGAELLAVEAADALPEEIRSGLVVAVGPSRDHRVLHLTHPLVAAAIEDARLQAGPSAARLALSGEEPAELRELRGTTLRLRLVKVSFDGFERVEQLVPVAVAQSGEVLPTDLAHLLVHAKLTSSTPAATPAVPENAMQDGVDEALFRLQVSVDAAEHEEFERASRQAERFVEDRLLVLKQHRRRLVDQLEEARRRRDGAASSEARSSSELAIARAEAALDEVDARMARLAAKDDPTFQNYQSLIQRRRYTPPQVLPLIDVELAIV